MSITTRVMDTATGGPARGVTVILELRQAGEWSPIGRGTTDEHGRLSTLTEGRVITPGTYQLTFDIGTYHRDGGLAVPFFPEAKIIFNVRDPDALYDLSLFLSPFGFSAFRQS